MPNVLEVLGQAAPAAATETDLATVPGATNYLVSSIVITNRSATPTTFRLSVSVGGGATQTKDYLAFDAPIDGNDVVVYTVGLGMQQTDVLRCYATLATLSFNAMGQSQT